MGTMTMAAAVASEISLKKILFATDFSEYSNAALPFAVALAKHQGATLFVAHVVAAEVRPPVSIEPMAAELDVPRLRAQQHMEKLERSGALRGVAHEPILRHGALWDELSEIIASRRIDLAVVGTHGRTGLRKLVMGSAAEKIFRSARCPVLTVGPHVDAGVLRAGKFRHVLFATDFSWGSLHALPYAIALANEQGSRLTLLHVVHLLPAVPVELGAAGFSTECAATDARRHLRELIPAIRLRCEIGVVVREGIAAEVILDTAQEVQADMVVMGVHSGRFGASHNPWTIADTVVCRAHCPVLTVREEAGI